MIFSKVLVITIIITHSLLHDGCHGHLRGISEHLFSPSSRPSTTTTRSDHMTPAQCHKRRLRASSIKSEKLDVDEWPNNSWDKANIKVINSICESKWKDYVKQAVHDWNLSTVIEIKTYSWKDNKCDPRHNQYDGYVNIVDGNWPGADWEGQATFKFSFSEGKWWLKSVLLQLNNYYLMRRGSADSYEANRRQSICHEIGHAIGLKHPDEDNRNKNTGSCMDYSNAPEGGEKGGIDYGPSNIRPAHKDYAALYKAYRTPEDRLLKHENAFYYRSMSDTNTSSIAGDEIDSYVLQEMMEDNPSKINAAKEEGNDSDTEFVHILEENTLTILESKEQDDSNDMGDIVVESHCNGIVEKMYDKIDSNGLLSIRVSTGREYK